MRLIVEFALRDLRRDWVSVVCNVAVLAGVIVPLLVLFGVRNGVYNAMLGRLLSDPKTLQIDTRGNNSFGPDDAAEVRTWREAGFVTLKTRSLFDYVNVRAEKDGGIRDAVLSPSGAGDPLLPAEALGPDDVAISATLARELGITSGTRIDMVTQAPERARQLLLRVNVVGIVPEDRLSGRAVLAPLEKLDLIEAFYDEYALPDYGIVEGRPIAERVARFEGLRVYAVRLEDLAPLQTRIEQRFGVATEAATARVSSVLGLGRNLGLALALTAAIASVGLAAALVFGFWAEVARKRHAIASLALLGMDHRQIALFPVVQALTTAMLGLAASFLLFALAARLAEHLFDTGLTAEGGLVVIDAGQALAVVFGVLGFVAATSLAAAWSAQRTDPAIILRDAG